MNKNGFGDLKAMKGLSVILTVGLLVLAQQLAGFLKKHARALPAQPGPALESPATNRAPVRVVQWVGLEIPAEDDPIHLFDY